MIDQRLSIYSRCYLCIFIVTTTFIGSYSQVLIGPTPATEAVLVGTDHILTCRRGPDGAAGFVTWEEVATTTVAIFINDERQNPNPKYTNFNVGPDNLYDMVITNIAVEDEGTYVCRNTADTDSVTTITRTVEVPLTSFVLSQNDSPTSLVTVTEEVPSDIVCSAVGARPAVTILWYHTKDGGSKTPITEGVNQKNTDNGDTTNSVSTLTYTATKDYNGGSLRCETFGQIVAPVEEAEASLNVQYIPVVEVNYGGDKVTCTSDANPTVTPYQVKIFVNDTEEYSPTCEGTKCTLLLKVDYDTDIRCNATNSIGTGTATTVAIPGPPPPTTQPPTVKGTTKESDTGELTNPGTVNIGVIVGPLVAVLVVVAVVISAVVMLVKKKKSSPKEDVKETSTANAPQTYLELNPQTRQPESTYEQPKTNDPKDSETAHAYMDLNPHTRDEKTAYQDLNRQEKSPQGAGNSEYEEIDAGIKETNDKHAYVNVQVG